MPKLVLDKLVIALIDVFVIGGLNPRQIVERLAQVSKEAEHPFAVPHLRTVERYVRRVRIEDPSVPWSVDDADGPEGAIVLDAVSDLIDISGGQVTHLTRAEAQWLVQTKRVRPDVPRLVGLLLAKQYAITKDREPLDHFLALAPWRSVLHLRNYVRAVISGIQLPSVGVLFSATATLDLPPNELAAELVPLRDQIAGVAGGDVHPLMEIVRQLMPKSRTGTGSV